MYVLVTYDVETMTSDGRIHWLIPQYVKVLHMT